MSTTKADNPAAPRGFDSPVISRKDDHLNRWPLAREIFGIATTGPKEWSVRIGIYGEWGTGKTSVLRFVDSMASQAGHIVIWFDPWEHSTQHDLWQAFVLTVFDHLERKLGQVPGADQAKRKAWMDKAKGIVGAIAGIANDKAGKALDIGLNLVRKHFDFSPEDLASLQSILGDRRVIVLIDDLDRTAPELVPEILFALKELMDIPAFSFICAFDPFVVGEVLGKYHPGFGEGLKFLDKIIDYPRWLPPASAEGLANLSVAEAARSCNYVPQAAIRDAVSLLPKNPRAVRQFIRLLTLLKPHIERHYDCELNWPVILAANILKIRHPRFAHEVLDDAGFWRVIASPLPLLPGTDAHKKVDEAISERIQRARKDLGLALSGSDEKEIKESISALCSHAKSLSGLHAQSLLYQVKIAEAPAAVTRKEFDAFLSQWVPNQSREMAETWIEDHAQKVQRSDLDVYGEVLDAAVWRYADVVRHADEALAEGDKPTLTHQAASLFACLECLVFSLGKLNQATKLIGDRQLETLLSTFASLLDPSLPVRPESSVRNASFVLRLVEEWSPDVTPLLRLLYSSTFFGGVSAGELRKKLCAVAAPKYVRQTLANFRLAGFVQHLLHKHTATFDVNRMIWDLEDQVLVQLRSEALQVLAEAASNRAVQENAYELLRWFVLVDGREEPATRKSEEKLFSDQTLVDAIWDAAAATPLTARAVYQLRQLPLILQRLGIKCKSRPWWRQPSNNLFVPSPPSPAPDESESPMAQPS